MHFIQWVYKDDHRTCMHAFPYPCDVAMALDSAIAVAGAAMQHNRQSDAGPGEHFGCSAGN